MVHFKAVTGDGADEQRQQAQCAGIKHRISKGTTHILLQDQLLVILDQMESREKSSSQYIRTTILLTTIMSTNGTLQLFDESEITDATVKNR